MHLSNGTVTIFLCKRFILFPLFCHRLSSAILLPGFYLFSAFLSEISSCLLESSPSTSSGRRNVFPATFYTPKSKAVLYPYLLIYLIPNRSLSSRLSCFFSFRFFDTSLLLLYTFYCLIYTTYIVIKRKLWDHGQKVGFLLLSSSAISYYIHLLFILERNFAFRITV